MYEVDRAEGAKTALFTFGSFTNPGRSEPSYAFVNTVLRMRRNRKLSCDVYYFRARENDWYFSGIDGFNSFEDSCLELEKLANNYDNVIYLGNSMGGYAALAFGINLNADLILSFSPQTRFDKEFCDSIKEQRWQNEFQAMRLQKPVEQMAISSIWPDSYRRDVCIFVGGQCPQDIGYAADLEGRPKLNTVLFESSGHDLVHDLRASGELEQLIHDGLVAVSSA